MTMIDQAEIPQQVTRFYSNIEFATDMIKNRQIAFVHISMLNDPFDPYCFFETDFGNSYQNLLKYIKEKHPSDMRWFRAHITPQSWGRTVHDLKVLLQTVRTTSFVLSTSAPLANFRPRDNLYMWGHYANGHRGLAIEFDTRALARAVLTHHEAENGKPSEQSNVWAKIEYAKTFPPISAEHVYEFMKQEIELLRRRTFCQS